MQPDSSAKTPFAAIEERFGMTWLPRKRLEWQERAAKDNVEVVRPESHSPAEVGGLIINII